MEESHYFKKQEGTVLDASRIFLESIRKQHKIWSGRGKVFLLPHSKTYLNDKILK